MSTKICKEYIVNNLVKDYEAEIMDRWGSGIKPHNPKSWVRTKKYKVGPSTEYSEYPDATVRVFWLKDTDHITFAVIEKDGVILSWDDCSD